MSPARLETFADGVFAIAATLLILSVDGQAGGHGVDLGTQLYVLESSLFGGKTDAGL